MLTDGNDAAIFDSGSWISLDAPPPSPSAPRAPVRLRPCRTRLRHGAAHARDGHRFGHHRLEHALRLELNARRLAGLLQETQLDQVVGPATGGAASPTPIRRMLEDQGACSWGSRGRRVDGAPHRPMTSLAALATKMRITARIK